MTIPSLPVRPHSTAPGLFVVYNPDGSVAVRGRLVTIPTVGQRFSPLFIENIDTPNAKLEPWGQPSPDTGDDLDTPARPA